MLHLHNIEGSHYHRIVMVKICWFTYKLRGWPNTTGCLHTQTAKIINNIKRPFQFYTYGYYVCVIVTKVVWQISSKISQYCFTWSFVRLSSCHMYTDRQTDRFNLRGTCYGCRWPANCHIFLACRIIMSHWFSLTLVNQINAGIIH